MPIEVTKESVLPPGQHTGTIITGVEGTITYDKDEGPRDVVKVVIKPDYDPEDGSTVRNMEVAYSPTINGLSKLSRLLERLEMHPEAGATWDPAVLSGVEVAFSAVKNGEFVNIDGNSVRLPDSE